MNEICSLEELFNSLNIPICFLDQNHVYQFCNQAYLNEIMGNSKAILGKSINTVLPKRAVDKLLSSIQEAKNTQREVNYIYDATLTSKQKNTYSVSIKPLFDASTDIRGFLIVAQNIMQQHQVEFSLQQQLTQLQKNRDNKTYYLENIISHFPANVYWKDREGRILGDNLSHARMAGFNNQTEVIGKTDYDFPWKLQADRIRMNDTEVMRTKKIQVFEEVAFLKDSNEEHTFLTTKAPLYDVSGEIAGVLGISVDITDRKRYEIMLEEAKERAEAADKAKTEFLMNMRHDIRTPLTGIVGFSEVIKSEASDPKIKEYAENLVISSYALLGLLNEILEAIRVAAGEIPLIKKKFDLRAKIENIIQLNLAKASSKKIKLDVAYDKKIPHYLVGDSTRLHRIILELVNNALNFTNKGFVRISAELARQKDDGTAVIKIKVQDTGIGIPPNKAEEVFTRFNRLTPSYQGIYKGAGLGLAIVKQFVDEMNGEIYVESTVDQGTTFTCVFPLKEALLDEAEGIEKSNLASTTLPPSKKKNIKQAEEPQSEISKSYVLIVEDQAIAAMVVERTLNDLDCKVDVASDGLTAWELVQKNQYDLIFMDIGLPDIDGYEVTKRIRLAELATERHAPIIALTAHVDRESKQHCIESGMDAVLSKPLAKEKALDILNAFIPMRSKLQSEASEQAIEVLKEEDKVIDIEEAKKILGFNEDSLRHLFATFVEGLQESKQGLEEAYIKQDWQQIKALAHKLKSGSLYCGAKRLQKICDEVQNLHINGDISDQQEDLYQQLITEIDAAMGELSTLTNQ